MDPTSAASIDPTDLPRYERLGAKWWDENGPMGQLHRFNPARIGFIRDLAVKHFGRPIGSSTGVPGGPLSGLSILDIGCGGGVLAEPLARLGAAVTGIDPGQENITVARAHADAVGLAIDYRATTLEALGTDRPRFDIVIASEVIEHVRDPGTFVGTAAGLVAPGGLLVVSTLNRTAKSFLLAIVGAEYVLGWLPRGTHRWHQFVRPDELSRWIARGGLKPGKPTGIVFNPLSGLWALGADSDCNYIMGAERA